MLDISKFYARSFDLDHVNVFWEIEEVIASDDVIAFNFYLYKSESPGGPWNNPIVGPFSNKYFFQDTTNRTLHKDRKIYYLLKVEDKRTNETKTFGPTSQIPEPDLMALEFTRQEDMLLRQFIGRKCILFPVKTVGAPCICVSNVSKRSIVSNCETCYGTGKLGGYLSPIECFVQIDPHPKSVQMTQNITQNVNMTSARLINYPPVKPRDILVENENRRWMVHTVRLTERLRSPVHQELEIKEVLKSDITYKLPLNLDIMKTEGVVEERNFTNPQTIRNDTNETYTDKPRGVL